MTQSTQNKYSEVTFWDLVAKQRVYAAFDKEEYEAIFDRTLGHDLTGKTVLDIGSASGVSAAILAAKGAQVIGLDISPELITQAKHLWKDYADRLEFKVGDAENLDCSDGTVDACFFGGVLHHFPDCSRVYAEAQRVLKPGGKFIAIEPNRLDVLERIEWAIADLRGKLSPNEYPIDPRAMGQDLRLHGFQNIRYWTTRHDIPFLSQLPILRQFFSRQKGFEIKQPILRVINAMRPPENRGTFFILEGEKA